VAFKVYQTDHYCLFFRASYPEVGHCGSGSSISEINKTRNLKLNCATVDKLCSEITWHTVEDLRMLYDDVSLKRGNSQDLGNLCVVADSPSGYSNNISSHSYKSVFPVEKYSEYTGAVTKCYINSSSSPEHASLNDEHKSESEFNNPVPEVELVNKTSPSEVSTMPGPTERQSISSHHSSAKRRQGTKCDSVSSDDRYYPKRERSRSKYEKSVRKLRQKNIHTVVSEQEGTSRSSLEEKSDMPDILKTVIKDPLRYCQDDIISEGRKIEDNMIENGGKSEEQTKGNYSPNKEHNIFTLKTEKIELASNKESGTSKKKSSKLSKKQKCGSSLTIKHYFKMKNTEHVSSCSSSEHNVKTSDVSSSDDCVPSTPIHTTKFGIQYINKSQNSPVKSHTSLEHHLKDPKSSVRIQLTESESVDCDTVKSSSNTEMPLDDCSKRTKQEKCELSRKRVRNKPIAEVSKKVNAGILSYFGPPVQVIKCSDARKFELTDDTTCGADKENNFQFKRSPYTVNVPARKRPGKCGKGASLQRVCQQQLKSTVNAVNEEDTDNEYLYNSSRKELENIIKLSEDSLLCGIEQQGLKIVPDVSMKTIYRFETSYREETISGDNCETKYEEGVVISSDDKGQDFKVSHLTLEHLEQRFKNNVKYLRDIMKGEQYCWRHEQFKKGGPASRNLRYALATFPYTDSQLDHLLTLLREVFCRKHSFVTCADYIMKVLLPEATAKIFMDEFSLSHQEALQKIHEMCYPSCTSNDMSLAW
jgi:hypothetical protein